MGMRTLSAAVGVDDDVIIVGPERRKNFLQKPLCPHLSKQTGFQLGKALAARNQIDFPAPLDIGAGGRQVLVIQQLGHDSADVQQGGLSIREKRCGEIGLRIEVYAEDPPPLLGQYVG